jgi:hypothetical protein
MVGLISEKYIYNKGSFDFDTAKVCMVSWRLLSYRNVKMVVRLHVGFHESFWMVGAAPQD